MDSNSSQHRTGCRNWSHRVLHRGCRALSVAAHPALQGAQPQLPQTDRMFQWIAGDVILGSISVVCIYMCVCIDTLATNYIDKYDVCIYIYMCV